LPVGPYSGWSNCAALGLKKCPFRSEVIRG
jgi:hypothetical protein